MSLILIVNIFMMVIILIRLNKEKSWKFLNACLGKLVQSEYIWFFFFNEKNPVSPERTLRKKFFSIQFFFFTKEQE